MILEVAILDIKQGHKIQFEKDFKIAEKHIRSINGYLGHSLRQCLERSNRYILLVDWESLEAHKIGFRTSDTYLEWKRLLHHYYDPFPTVEHYKTIF